jgi:uncharacterized protein YqjF (DUF2071 family)
VHRRQEEQNLSPPELKKAGTGTETVTGTGSPFLRAKWKNLAIVTYKVPDEVLRPYLPPGCELDRLEGSALASFVAFDFKDTKVKGVGFPGFKNFPEINLRFYVKQGNRRGVVFIRELVPSRLIAGIARGLYNEPYQAVPMKSETRAEGGRLDVEHTFTVGGRTQRVRIEGSGELSVPPETSKQHFLKEQEWGFGVLRNGEVVRYRVTHPHWRTYASAKVDLDVDFGAVYGERFAFLSKAKPFSTVVAEGSEIAVLHKQPVEAN